MENSRKIYLIYDKLNHVLFLISLVLILIYYVNENIYFKMLVMLFGLIILFRYISVKSIVSYAIIISILTVVMFYLIKSLVYGNFSSLESYIYLFAQLGLAIYFVDSKYSRKIIQMIFIATTIYFFLQIFRGFSPSEMIISSENIVNFVFIAIGTALYIINYLNDRKIPLYPVLIILLVSLITSGRSGIISSLLLLIIVINFKYKWKIKYLIMISIISLLFSNKFIQITQNFFENIVTRFGTRSNLGENVRFKIWDSYLNDLNLTRFIFGFDDSRKNYFFGFENPHNSFLSGHYTFGIIQLIITIIIIYILFVQIKNNEYFVPSLLVILFIRSFSDKVLFIGNFDFVYLAIILISIFRMNSSKRFLFKNYNEKTYRSI